MTLLLEQPDKTLPLVLCADDDEALLGMLSTLLDTAGYRTVLAHDGTEALMLFAEYRQELSAIILDVRMPQKNGIQVALEIRKVSPGIPLIALSAYLGKHDHGDALEQCQAAGFSAIMSKPFSLEPFLSALSEWVERFRNLKDD